MSAVRVTQEGSMKQLKKGHWQKHIGKVADAIDTVANYAEEVDWVEKGQLIWSLDQLWEEEVKEHLEKEDV